MRILKVLSAKTAMAVFLFGLFSLLADNGQAAEKMRHFALPSAHDNIVIDSKSYQGQTILINFFATWCPPCRKEIPSLAALQKKYGPQGLAVIGISTDEGGSSQVVRFAEKMGINYPVLMSDQQTLNSFGGIFGIPTTFLVNTKGFIVKRFEGYTDQKILEKELNKILP